MITRWPSLKIYPQKGKILYLENYPIYGRQENAKQTPDFNSLLYT